LGGTIGIGQVRRVEHVAQRDVEGVERLAIDAFIGLHGEMQRDRGVGFGDIDGAAVIVENGGELVLEIGAEQIRRRHRGAIEARRMQEAVGQGAFMPAIAGGAHFHLRIAGAHPPLGHHAPRQLGQMAADEAGIAVIKLCQMLPGRCRIGEGLLFEAGRADRGHDALSSCGPRIGPGLRTESRLAGTAAL
jgi:hypothetical protein